MIPNIGPMELAIVLLIAMIVLGPRRLPEMGRSLGRGLREFRVSISGDERRGAGGEASSAPVVGPGPLRSESERLDTVKD